MQQTYARINADGEVVQWPVLPAHIASSGLPRRFFEAVKAAPPPDHNHVTHNAAPRAPVRDAGGNLVQRWEIVPLTLDQVRQTQLAALADLRWRKETGGVSLPDGGAINTSREAQAQVSSAFSALQSGMIATIEWKSVLGWVTVTLAEFTPVASVVAQHVQACFAAERAVALSIEAAQSVDDLAALSLFADFEAAYAVAMAQSST